MSEKRAFHIEHTEAQTLGQQQEAEELSLRSTAPPATLLAIAWNVFWERARLVKFGMVAT